MMPVTLGYVLTESKVRIFRDDSTTYLYGKNSRRVSAGIRLCRNVL